MAASAPDREITAAARSIEARWAQLPTLRRQLLVLAALIAAWVGTCALARWRGVRLATITLLMLAVPLSVALGRGQGAASVLLVGMVFALAVIAGFVFMFTFRLYRSVVFERFR